MWPFTSSSPAKKAGPAQGGPLDPAAVEKFLKYLSDRGRYFAVRRPDGRVVHILGVIPGSQASCREAKNLVLALRPDTVYVDTLVGNVPTLRKHIMLGGPPRLTAPPPAEIRMDHGLAMSTQRHKAACEAGMYRMLGVDPDDVWRTGVAEADKAGARVLAWPAHFDKRYNNNLAAFERFGGIGFDVFGSAGFWSTQVSLVSMIEMTPIKVLDGLSSPVGQVITPPSGYFTTTQLERLCKQHRQAFDAFAKKNSARSTDFEVHFTGQIRDFHDRIARGGDASPDPTAPPADRLPVGEARSMLAQLELARDLFAVQAQTLAGVLVGDDDLAAADAAMDRAGVDAGARPAAAAAGATASAAPRSPETVALVELPRVAGLLRAWDSPMPVSEGLVERDVNGFAMQVGVPVVGAAGFAYAYHRLLIRRFPRAAGGLAAVALVGGGAAYGMSMFVGGYAPFGVGMWQSLAAPVVPVGQTLGLGDEKKRA